MILLGFISAGDTASGHYAQGGRRVDWSKMSETLKIYTMAYNYFMTSCEEVLQGQLGEHSYHLDHAKAAKQHATRVLRQYEKTGRISYMYCGGR